jgi:hypothetical protein
MSDAGAEVGAEVGADAGADASWLVASILFVA